jgi:CHASE2 domain-containing sensor protein
MRTPLRLPVVLFLALVTTAVVSIAFDGLDSLRAPDEFLYALRFPTGDRVSRDIVLVEITRDTLKLLGDPPWDRRIHARALETLARNPGTVIGVTLLFDQPLSEPGDSLMAATIMRYRNIVFGRPTVPDGQLFYRALQDAKPTTGALDVPIDTDIMVAIAPTFRDPLTTPPSSLEVLPVKLFQMFQAERSRQREPPRASPSPCDADIICRQSRKLSLSDPLSLSFLRTRIPINFVGDIDAFTRMPYERLLTGEDFSWLAGKVILVGSTASADKLFTPLTVRTAASTSPIGIWANALNTLLTDQQIRVLPPLLTHILLFGFCLILIVIFDRLQSWRWQVAVGMSSVGLIVIALQILFWGFRFQMVLMPYLLVWLGVQGLLCAKILWERQRAPA